MIDIEKPKIEIVEISEDNRYGKFVCEPLERGYGTTFGNSLRRMLLSSLEGSAITSIRIDGVLHEFSTIPGVRDDVTNIVLNLKQLCLKMAGSEPKVIRIDVEGEKEVTAADIICDADIEILNPDLHIATVDATGKLKIEMTVARGRGYIPAERNKKPDDTIGVIPIDSIFSPVQRVNYTVQDTRVGNETDYDKLILEVWTDGSLRPEEAVSKAAGILVMHLKLFQSMDGLPEEIEEAEEDWDELRAVYLGMCAKIDAQFRRLTDKPFCITEFNYAAPGRFRGVGGIATGALKLVGTDEADVYAAFRSLLDDEAEYARMASAANPYGDGNACQRIAQVILWHFGRIPEKPADFGA